MLCVHHGPLCWLLQSWSSGKYPLIEHEYDAIVVYVSLFDDVSGVLRLTPSDSVVLEEQVYVLRSVSLRLDSTRLVSLSCSLHEVIRLPHRYVVFPGMNFEMPNAGYF